MTSTTKRVDFTISPKLKDLGFTRIYSMGKSLVLETKERGIIICKYDYGDLHKTVDRYVSDELDKSGFKDDNEVICTEIMRMLFEAQVQQCDQVVSEEQKEQLAATKLEDEINQLRKQNPNLTLEEWHKQLKERLQTVKNVVNQTMPEIWPGLEYELSILRILDLQDCSLPFIGIILGRPSSYKSVIIKLLKDWHKKTYYTDNFTPKSFVTHTTAVDNEEDLAKIDMLPKIRNKLLLTVELSPLFTSKEEDLMILLGIITRVADGDGYLSDSGAHGQRGYSGNYMLTWVGAAVDIPYKVYKILHTLGPRMYFFRMKFEDQTLEELLEYAVMDQDFKSKELLVKTALFEYLKWFEIGPMMTPEGKIKWDFEADSREALSYISRMADLLSFLRCTAVTWETPGTQGSDYSYSISQREKPTRAISHLKNLARGHGLIEGRNHITLDDIEVVIKTVLDTAPIERVSMLSLLIVNNGILTTDEILQSLRVSRPTALRTMAEFHAIGLVDMENFKEGGQNNNSKRIVLNSRFDWLLSDPVIKKIYPHTNTKIEAPTDIAREYIIIGVFDELQKEEAASNISERDKLTVNRQKLEQRLIDTGQFYNGDATRLVTQMIEAGKLKEVMQDTLMRV